MTEFIKSPRLLLWLVGIGFFMETLDSTIVNTALPAMAKSLGESPLSMQSVVIAYSLTLAVLIPASGWLADKFGTRKVFFSAILIFTLGSILCALSQTIFQLTAARVLQGMGGSMLMPIGRLAVLIAFPGEAYLEAISFVAIPALIGPLIGPTLGGWIVQYFSWHWIFLINIPIGILGCFATFYAMPDSKSDSVPRFDIEGFILLALAMVSISFGLDGLAELGFSGITVAIILFFGFACLSAYWLRSSRVENALFSPKMFRVPTFSIGLLGNLFSRVGSSGMPFLIPLLLQVGLDYTPFEAGMMMIPTAVGAMVVKRYASPLLKWLGYRRFLIINTFLVGLVIASLALLSPQEPNIVRILQLLIFGGINSLQYSAMNSLTLKDLEKGKASGGNSLFSMVQMLAMSFAVCICAAVLTSFMTLYEGHASRAGQLHALHATFVSMGVLTCISVCIYLQLSPDVVMKKPDAPRVSPGG